MIQAKTLTGEDLPWSEARARLQAAHTGQPDGLWIHAETPSDSELAELRELLTLHPLALDDATEEGYWSRFAAYPAHDFLTYRSLADTEKRTTERLSLFLFARGILSLSWRALSYFPAVWEMVGRHSVNTPAEITYELIEHGTDSFLLYAQQLEEQIDALQERVFEDSHFDATPLTFELKRQLAGVRHLATEGREAVLMLARHSQNSESADLILYRDALSNLDRAVARLEAQRESLTTLLDTYLGFQSQRMNQVMRTLTAVSTVFLPLTFLAGVWGMNFKHMPELDWPYGYALAWASFLLIAAGLAYYFKRRDWW